MLDVLMYIVNGLALKFLWGWFMAKKFELPQLSVPEAIGIILVASLLSHQFIPKKVDKETITELYGFNFGMPCVVFVFGWIAHFFI